MLFLVTELDLCAMQIVDVEGGTDPIDNDAAGFSRNQREAVVAPFAVGAREPRLERERLLLSEALGEGFAGDRPVVGMNMTKAVLVEGAQTTEISGEGRIHVADGAVRRHGPDELRQGIRKQPVARLALGGPLLGTVVFGRGSPREGKPRQQPSETIQKLQMKSRTRRRLSKTAGELRSVMVLPRTRAIEGELAAIAMPRVGSNDATAAQAGASGPPYQGAR